jgi:hypothetical protein
MFNIFRVCSLKAGDVGTCRPLPSDVDTNLYLGMLGMYSHLSKYHVGILILPETMGITAKKIISHYHRLLTECVEYGRDKLLHVTLHSTRLWTILTSC